MAIRLISQKYALNELTGDDSVTTFKRSLNVVTEYIYIYLFREYIYIFKVYLNIYTVLD